MSSSVQTDWSMLKDAHGSAAGIPELLDRFEADPQEAWAELMDRLCPRLDTVFSASFAALSRLVAIAAAREPADRPWVLIAAGPIVACMRRSPEGDTACAVWAEEIAELARLTAPCLRLSLEPEEYIFLLQAALSFQGVAVWDERLDHLAEGEYEVDCPYCGMSLFIVLGAQGFFSCDDDYASTHVVRAPLRPVGAEDLQGPGRRLYEEAASAGQHMVAHRLTHLFGRATCTGCGTLFSVADRVAAPRPSLPGRVRPT